MSLKLRERLIRSLFFRRFLIFQYQSKLSNTNSKSPSKNFQRILVDSRHVRICQRLAYRLVTSFAVRNWGTDSLAWQRTHSESSVSRSLELGSANWMSFWWTIWVAYWYCSGFCLLFEGVKIVADCDVDEAMTLIFMLKGKPGYAPRIWSPGTLQRELCLGRLVNRWSVTRTWLCFRLVTRRSLEVQLKKRHSAFN